MEHDDLNILCHHCDMSSESIGSPSGSRSVESPKRWKAVYDELCSSAKGPSDAQFELAKKLDIELPRETPAPVAAAILSDHLAKELYLSATPFDDGDIPASLHELEKELNVKQTTKLHTRTRMELSAWYTSRYMLLRARALNQLRPDPGDVVTSEMWEKKETRTISSISSDGRIHMSKWPNRSSWPDRLRIVAKIGSTEYEAAKEKSDAWCLNNRNYSGVSFGQMEALKPYKVRDRQPSPQAIESLERLLDDSSTTEQGLHAVLEENPELFSCLVPGSHGIYVFSKKKLGAEFVPDFLVLGIDSTGPCWVMVEIEKHTHKMTMQDGGPSGPTRHAQKQIDDWREWLTINVQYAQTTLQLYGLTNRAPGVVIIGRGNASTKRQPGRKAMNENSETQVHSWDWLLREARVRLNNSMYATPTLFGMD